MPLKIITDYSDPAHTRRVIYVPDRADQRSARPSGKMFRDHAGQLRNRDAARLPAQFFVGLDLGQANDYTAICILQKTAEGLSVVFLDRVRGQPYPVIVQHVYALMSRPELAGQSILIADATGVGAAVLDLLRSAGLQPIALTITGGRKVTGNRSAPKVPKAHLVDALLLAFQSGSLRIASDLAHASTLAAELAEMRRKLSVAGRASYGAWREGTHDDLVLALAISLWRAERPGTTMAAPALPDRPDYSHELPDDADDSPDE